MNETIVKVEIRKVDGITHPWWHYNIQGFDTKGRAFSVGASVMTAAIAVDAVTNFFNTTPHNDDGDFDSIVLRK